MAGHDVKRELRRRGWTLTRLAETVGVSVAMVSLLVNGKLVSPFLQEAISDVVGAPARDLFGPLYWRGFLRTRYPRMAHIPERGISV